MEISNDASLNHPSARGARRFSHALWLCTSGLTLLAASSCATASTDYSGDPGLQGGTTSASSGASGAVTAGTQSGSGSGGSGNARGGGAGGGGTSTGGSANGGTPSGGSASGGAPSGGAPSGGAASGGAPSGGAASAGSPSAGAGGSSGPKCAPESCNGLDDDCNQVIDNGCPSTFLRGAVTAGTALGDSTGGSLYSETCGPDEVLVGLQVGFSKWLDQINAKCQQFSLTVDKSVAPYKYAVTLGTSHVLAAHPPTSNDAIQTLTCPAGKVLVGISIAEQHTAPAYMPDYLVITRASVTCADLVLELTVAPPTLKWKTPTTIGPISASFYDGASATAKSTTLNSSQIAVGYQGSAGLWVDRIGPVVSSVQIVVQ